MITLIRCASNNKDFQKLTSLLDLDLKTRYGDIQAQYNQYNKTDAIKNVIVVYNNEIPIGCGCFKKYDYETIEIKRMFVKPENRGLGIAKRILTEIENWAKEEEEFNYSILETGIEQPEAISLYYKLGYFVIENYGQYVGNQNSICMRKLLS